MTNKGVWGLYLAPESCSNKKNTGNIFWYLAMCLDKETSVDTTQGQYYSALSGIKTPHSKEFLKSINLAVGQKAVYV